MLLACNDENNNEKDSVYCQQSFVIRDKEGNDLINPNSPNIIDYNKIIIYHYKNGEKIKASNTIVYSPDIIADDLPGFYVDSYIDYLEKQKYFINVSLNQNPIGSSDTTYTLIEWNQNGWKTDTITSKISQGASYLTVGMVMFNDSVWNTNHIPPSELHNISEGEASFTIVK